MSIEETIRAAVASEIDRALMPILALLEARSPEGPSGPLSVPELAARSHRHADTIRRAIKAGTLRAFRPAGSREWAIEAEEARRWMGIGVKRARVVDLRAEAGHAIARALKVAGR